MGRMKAISSKVTSSWRSSSTVSEININFINRHLVFPCHHWAPYSFSWRCSTSHPFTTYFTAHTLFLTFSMSMPHPRCWYANRNIYYSRHFLNPQCPSHPHTQSGLTIRHVLPTATSGTAHHLFNTFGHWPQFLLRKPTRTWPWKTVPSTCPLRTVVIQNRYYCTTYLTYVVFPIFVVSNRHFLPRQKSMTSYDPRHTDYSYSVEYMNFLVWSGIFRSAYQCSTVWKNGVGDK